ncbi:hypothetical protein ACJ41O_013786 [Fusarium nematophilum]
MNQYRSPVYDLTALPSPSQIPTAGHYPQFNCNLTPETRSAYSRDAAPHVEHRGVNHLEAAKARQPAKANNPLAPRQPSKVHKSGHFLTLADKRSTTTREQRPPPPVLDQRPRGNSDGTSANNPIIIDTPPKRGNDPVNPSSNLPKDDKEPATHGNQPPERTNEAPEPANATQPADDDHASSFYKRSQAFTHDECIPPPNPAVDARPPLPPSAAELLRPHGALRFQICTARHLAHIGVDGPYEIGDFLCDIHRGSGKIIKFAESEVGPDGKVFWRHIMTGQRVEPEDKSGLCGKPVALSNGTFFGLNDEKGQTIRPEWQFRPPTHPPGPAKPPPKDNGFPGPNPAFN